MEGRHVVGFDDLDKNIEALNEGLVEYLVTRHILMHMDILHRLNSKHYSI